MIPVIGLLHYGSPAVTQKAIDCIPVGRAEHIVIVDNSPSGDSPSREDIRVMHLRANMGVAHGWNTIIKSTPWAEWWAIFNNDVELVPDDFDRLEAHMVGHDLCLMDAFHAFGIRRSAIKRIGWFDEGFHPAYCEDNDYCWRAQMAGLAIANAHPVRHFSSAVIKNDAALRARNDSTYPRNVEFYLSKWGGHMNNEVYTTPFDGGGSLEASGPDIDRLAEQRWG